MSFLSRVFSALSPKKRRPGSARAVRLGIESLEERWTPAVSITGQGTDTVTIEDSAAGQTNNAIEIIDDLDTQRTYIKINGGPEQVLGLNNTLLTNLVVRMGAGKDKVTFTTRGDDNSFNHDLQRSIDLGAGDDSLVVNFSPTADVHGYVLNYAIVGDTSGNDSYTLKGTVNTGQLFFDLDTVNETAGNDAYNIDVTATHFSQVRILIEDEAGNDRYTSKLASIENMSAVRTFISDALGNDVYSTLTTGQNSGDIVGTQLRDLAGNDTYTIAFGASTAATELHSQIVDQGLGKNKIFVTQGDLDGSLLNVEFLFNVSPSNNSFSIGGNGIVQSSAINYAITTGGGADKVSIDDNMVSTQAFITYDVQTGAGNDAVSIKFDGSPKWTLADQLMDSSAKARVDLGEGNDSFTALFAKGWYIDTSDFTEATFKLDVLGGQGNDKLVMKTDGKQINVFGSEVVFDVLLDGGDGNDVIDVNLGAVGARSFLPATISFTLLGGTGSDKFSFAGTVKIDDAETLWKVYADLGDDEVKDTFKSTFKYAKGPILSTFDGHFEHAIVDQDAVKLISGSTAPDWTGLA